MRERKKRESKRDQRKEKVRDIKSRKTDLLLAGSISHWNIPSIKAVLNILVFEYTLIKNYH